MDNNQNFGGLNDYQPDVSGNAKLFSALAYLGILFILGLVIEPEKDNPFVKAHVNNGILIMIAYFISAIICVIPLIGAIVGGLVMLALLVFQILGIVNAAQGKPFVIPFTEQFNIVK